MPVQVKPNKRDAILNAMLEVVVERGFHEAPMSLVSERSGASAGVIYHHFSSKDEIIQALYRRVADLEMANLLAGYSAEMDDRAAFLHVWENLYRFHREHQKEMRFLEQYRHAGFDCHLEQKAPEFLAFGRRFSARSEGGVLADWPADVLEVMTVGLVAELARQPRELTPEMRQVIAEKMWEMVRSSA